MVTHLSTEIVRPLWALPDDEVPVTEQRKRLAKFAAAKDLADKDCTTIVQLCSLWKDKGLYANFAATWDAFCVDVLGIEPAWVDKVCSGFQLLKASGHDGEVTADHAIQLGTHGGDRRSGQAIEIQGTESTLKRGGNPSYLRARLERDNPEIIQALDHGDYSSIHAAAKAAGIVKDPTPLTQLRRVWKKATPDERAAFLAEIREEHTHDPLV